MLLILAQLMVSLLFNWYPTLLSNNLAGRERIYWRH